MTPAINTEVSSSPKNPKATDFAPGMFAGGISSTPLTGNGLRETSKESSHGVSEAQSPQLAELRMLSSYSRSKMRQLLRRTNS